jgi:hypothetical protein
LIQRANRPIAFSVSTSTAAIAAWPARMALKIIPFAAARDRTNGPRAIDNA